MFGLVWLHIWIHILWTCVALMRRGNAFIEHDETAGPTNVCSQRLRIISGGYIVSWTHHQWCFIHPWSWDIVTFNVSKQFIMYFFYHWFEHDILCIYMYIHIHSIYTYVYTVYIHISLQIQTLTAVTLPWIDKTWWDYKMEYPPFITLNMNICIHL